MKRWINRCLAGASVFAMLAHVAPALGQGNVRIKDITDFEGGESNRVLGYGLVIGLAGTGGKSTLTQKTAVDMLQRFNVASKFQGDAKDAIFRSGNVSAVMVTAELGPYARTGSRVDVTVSVLDDATSLQGGELLWTPLKAVDGVDYIVASGNVNCGAFLATASGGGGGTAASATKNHPTVGRVVNGGAVVRECRGRLLQHGTLRILIRDPDPTTARAIAKSINTKFSNTAFAADNGTIHVYVPRERCNNLVSFMSDIGTLEITPDSPARVLINSRTGTIIAGHNVKISSVAVTHGNLAIIVNNEPKVSQPNAFSGGKTKTVPSGQVGVTEQGGNVTVMEGTMTVGELANALNRLGASPRDLIIIFEGLKKMGALHADLVPM
jgi:flagellar P-ring protein precursor FlgI